MNANTNEPYTINFGNGFALEMPQMGFAWIDGELRSIHMGDKVFMSDERRDAEMDAVNMKAMNLSYDNKRLKDLVVTMYEYYVGGTTQDCDLCKWRDKCTYESSGRCRYKEHEDAAKEYFAKEFSELGIEVC